MARRATNRFFMRPMNLDDIETITGWLQDVDDLSLFDRTLTLPPGKDAVQNSWKADFAEAKIPTAYWFIVQTASGEPVAIGGLQSINYIHGDAVIPILVSKEARGEGLGLCISILMLDMAFDRLRLRRVTTYYRADNSRTARLIERAGFVEEGRLREAWLVEGEFLDCVVVGLLRDEWYARREALKGELDGSVEVVLGAPANVKRRRATRSTGR
jgi:RimJ/RimL family protein N-acetyltransferase